MSRKQELFEQYIDAFFAVEMDQIALEEGRSAINLTQQLKKDPNAEVPKAVQKRCEKTIQKAFLTQRRKKTGHILWRALRVASIVVLLLAATMTLSFAAFPELRMTVINMILETYDTHTEFSFEEKNDVSPELEITLGWIPYGFVVSEDDSTPDCAWKCLENVEGATIFVEKTTPNSISIDTEDAQIEEIEIQGYEATLITKPGEARVIWLNEDENIIYFIDSEDVPVDTMLQVAKNVS